MVTKSRQTTNTVWWTGTDRVLDSVVSDYTGLATDRARTSAYRTYGMLYANRNVSSQSLLGEYNAIWQIEENSYSRVPLNVIKSNVDEVVARLVRTTPRASFLTNNGNWSLRRKAKNMERFVDSVVHAELLGAKEASVLRDGCLYGLGAVKIYKAPHEQRVAIDHVYPGHLFVDPVETLYGEPRRLFQRQLVGKELLKKLFPKFEKEIEGAEFISDIDNETHGFTHSMEQVEVVEAWHLPSFDGAGDGKRVLFIESAVLEEEPWERSDFPFATFLWREETFNKFYGTGLAEELLGIHLDVNVTLEHIQRAIELVPKPAVFVPQGSLVSPTEVTNLPGQIFEYTGNIPPQFEMMRSIPPDLLQHLGFQLDRARQVAGLGGGGTTGSGLPAGLETGAAVRSAFDVDNVPFVPQMKRRESFYMRVAEKILSVGREIHDKSGPKGFSVVLAKDKHTIDELDWSEVDINPRENSYVVRVAPTSVLSQHPSGRIDDVINMINSQMIDTETGKKLLDFPDIDEHMSLATAVSDNIDRHIELILDDEVFTPPSPFTDPKLALAKANAAYNRAEVNGVPEPNLSLLRTYMEKCNEIIAKTEQATLARQQGLQPNPAGPPAVSPDGSVPTAINGTI